MKMQLEKIDQPDRFLFIADSDREPYSLKKTLAPYRPLITIRPDWPEDLAAFSTIFVIGKMISEKDIKTLIACKVNTVIITADATIFNQLQKEIRGDNIKIVCAATIDDEAAEKIIWFSVSETKEKFLDLMTLPRYKKPDKKPPFNLKSFSRRQKAAIIIAIIFIWQGFFIIPWSVASFLLYQSTTQIKSQYQQADQSVRLATTWVDLTAKSYAVARPLYSFFYLGLFPDTVVKLNEQWLAALQSAIIVEISGRQLAQTVVNSSLENKADIAGNLNQLTHHFNIINSNLGEMSDELSALKLNIFKDRASQLANIAASTQTLSKIIPRLSDIIAISGDRKYLLFFYNNMELRPGGGFIGSYAIIKFHHGHLKELTVHDVYEADGQLKTHVEPPTAIAKYLNQPHWFLRDSAFSPDFPQNAATAKIFLKKEIGESDFDGELAITTTGVTDLLQAFGDVYIPDFKQTINSDNFYLNSQLAVENDFFPGSTKKKDFLGELFDAMIIKSDAVSPVALFGQIKKAADEKQLVIFFENPALQTFFDELNWGGRQHNAVCSRQSSQCVANNIFPVEANLGVNKANYFINRHLRVQSEITPEGILATTVATVIKNNSPSDTYPTGTYRDYYQLFLPVSAKIKKVLIDGADTTDFTQKNTGELTVVGTFVEIPPAQARIITVTYELDSGFKTGRNTYQLTVQKQIGTSNADLDIELKWPQNMAVISKNFNTVEKNGFLLYNTSLSQDKIFIMEIIRK